MKTKHISLLLICLGASLLVADLFVLATVSPGTFLLHIHVEDVYDNPIEGMSVWALPLYGEPPPPYPPPDTHSSYLTDANGNVNVVLTSLNTSPVPDTVNSTNAKILFYHPDYIYITPTSPDMPNEGVLYGYSAAWNWRTPLDGGEGSLTVTFTPEGTFFDEILDTFSLYQIVAGVFVGTGCVLYVFKGRKKQ